MHIVHVVESLDIEYGGPAQSVPLLARESLRFGADVSFVSANWTSKEQHNPIIENMDAEWTRLKRSGPDKLAFSRGLFDVMERLVRVPSTIVHIHNLWNYFPYAAYRVARSHDIPMVISLRGTMSDWAWSQRKSAKRIAWKVFQYQMLNMASCLHATSMEEFQSTVNRGVTAPLTLIPNGVDLSEFAILPTRTHAVTSLGIDASKRNLLFLSRLHQKKGIEKLIESWANLSKRARDGWQLLIAGDAKHSSYRRSLERKVAGSGTKQSVVFLGHLDNTERLNAYAASDAFVLPSFSENFGIVILEALAAGLPVITTTATPWSVIADQGAGYFIPLDGDRLVEAMEAIMTNDAKRQEMSQVAWRIAQEYSWRNIGVSFQEVYNWVLDPINHVIPDVIGNR